MSANDLLQADFGVTTSAGVVRRLSESTRLLAARALSGEFGRPMVAAPFRVEVSPPSGAEAERQYAEVISRIALQAPLRLVPGERLVGAATLIEAARHQVPGCNLKGTSHTTIGLNRILELGYAGLREQVRQRLEQNDLDEHGRAFVQSMAACIEAAGQWHDRYVQALIDERKAHPGPQGEWLDELQELLERVPEHPPRTFHEALQALWSAWCFQRLCGNWSGLGRLDAMLGKYLDDDLAAGRQTLDEARELLAHFWIKGCEWVGAAESFGLHSTGDAQFYQNVILGGVDSSGREVTNNVTWLILDVVEELHISDFPIAVRVNSYTSPQMWRRIAQLQRRGGGIVSIYNEQVVLDALEQFGYPPEVARNFSNDGCWEAIIPGQTAFSYLPFDALQVLQQTLGLEGENATVPTAATFDDFYRQYLAQLERRIDTLHNDIDARFSNGTPSALLSLFVDDCLSRGRGYHDRGARYSVVAIHAGGLPDVANSLLAISKLVYRERLLSLAELRDILRSNWQGFETQRSQIQRQLCCYGNDDDQSDLLMQRLYDDYVALASRLGERAGVLRPVGISTFGREIEYSRHRLATAFGRHSGEILATNLSPTPGTDGRGPTAVIRSFCKMDFRRMSNGVPLELKLLPDALNGEKGLAVLESLLRSFVSLGGFYLQVDAVDNETLRDAQRNPQRYPNLCVRISGWSARFVTLSPQWQQMIIQRTQQR